MNIDLLNSIHYILSMFCVLQFSDKWHLGLLSIHHWWRLKNKKSFSYQALKKHDFTNVSQEAGRESVYKKQGSIFHDYRIIYLSYAELTIDWQTSTGQMRRGKENNIRARKLMEYICQFWTENSEFGLI